MSTGPERSSVIAELDECIAACGDCIEACEDSATESLHIHTGELVSATFLADLDCVDVCTATMNSLLRYDGYDRHVTLAITETCRVVVRSTARQLEHSDVLNAAAIRASHACRQVEDACARLAFALVTANVT